MGLPYMPVIEYVAFKTSIFTDMKQVKLRNPTYKENLYHW